MSVWYGGVKLTVPDQDNQAWIEGNISLKDVYEFRAYSWPPSGNASWPVPPDRDTDRPIKLGSLFWPRGAQRWATFHYIINQPQLDDVRALVYADDTYTPLKLKIADGKDDDIYIDPLMYMLPPRPLQRTSWDAEHDWFLLTLVDQRYFWWEKVANIEVTEGTTTWAQLYALIASALGVTITVSTVDADYLKPTAAFSNRYAHIPRLLDAVANSCGQRIVRKLDGTVLAQSYTAAKAQYDLNIDLEAVKRAGGHFDFDDTETNDLAALVPSSVTVVFPRADSGAVGSSFHTVNTTLTSLALAEFTDVTARSFTHLLRSSCIANFTGGGSPANNTEVAALASQMTTDWYKWQLGDMDIRLAGIYEWEPEGLHDHIEWSHDCTMRIQRGEWNELEDAQQHYGTYGASTTVVQNEIVVNDLTVNNSFSMVSTTTALGADTNNLAITTPTTYFNPSSSYTITGLAYTNPSEGQIIDIYNSSTSYAIKLAYQSGSSSSANRFYFPTQTDYYMWPQSGLTLQYLGGFWRPYLTPYTVYKPGAPAQITSNQNNYDIGLYLRIYLNTDASRNITGFANGFEGRRLEVFNNGSFPAVIVNNSGLSSVGNRIITGTGADVTIPALGSAIFDYVGAAGSGSWYLQYGSSLSSAAGTVTSFSAGDLAPLFTTSEATATTTPALTFAQITKTANYVFAGPTSGGAANPDFRALVAADISGISPVRLAGATVTNQATCDIVLPSGYKIYEIRIYDFTAKSAVQMLRIRTSTDGGSTFDTGGTDYKTGGVTGDYIATSFIASDDSSTSHVNSGIVTISNPFATVTHKHIWGQLTEPQAGSFTSFSGEREATGDLDAIRFYMSSGNINMSYVLIGYT